jgi:hypothetical protein
MEIDDFIYINNKISSKQNNVNIITLDNINIFPFLQDAYELAKNQNKRFIYLCPGDVPPVILPNDANILVFKTSLYNDIEKPINEHIIPPPDIHDNFSYFLENPDLSIGFVGQKNNGREKICEYFEKSGLKTNFILRDNYIFKLTKNLRKDFEDNMNNNLFTLCYRGHGNFSARFYETLMRGRIPIQINSSSIFPYENEINYSDIGIFIDEEDLETIDIQKVVRDYYDQKSANELLQIQKNNRRIFMEYFHMDNYFSKIFCSVKRIMENEIIFPIGASNENSIIIKLTNNKDYSKKWYISPFGDNCTNFREENPFEIIYSAQNKTITITKIKSNSIDLLENGWKIPLQLWYPHDVTDFIIPPYYGILKRNNIIKKLYKYGVVIPFSSCTNKIKEFLESLQKADLSECLIVFIDISNEDQNYIKSLMKNFKIPNLLKVYKNVNVDRNLFDSLLTGLDMIYPFCEYLIILNSNIIMQKNWISKIDESYCAMKNDYPGNKFILISGFNITHTEIDEGKQYILTNNIGGTNLFFHRDIYPDYIRKTFISHLWDSNIISYIKELGGIIGVTNPNVIQYIE